MKYKLIACDMDETFLNDKSLIPENNKMMVDLLDEKYGIKFVPASGRGVNTLQQEINWLGFDKKDEEYVIGLNGATISETKDGKILSFTGLDFELASKIYKFGITKKLGVHVYTYDNIYIYNNNEDEISRTEDKGISWTEISDDNIEFLRDIPIAKMMYQNTDLAYLSKVKGELEKLISNLVNFSYSSHRYLEINALNVDKGMGLKKLCEILGISLEETIAIGDNHNDSAMLKIAGLSVAVSNAVEEVKEIVDYVAKSSNNDGILEEIYNKFIK